MEAREFRVEETKLRVQGDQVTGVPRKEQQGEQKEILEICRESPFSIQLRIIECIYTMNCTRPGKNALKELEKIVPFIHTSQVKNNTHSQQADRKN